MQVVCVDLMGVNPAKPVPNFYLWYQREYATNNGVDRLINFKTRRIIYLTGNGVGQFLGHEFSPLVCTLIFSVSNSLMCTFFEVKHST